MQLLCIFIFRGSLLYACVKTGGTIVYNIFPIWQWNCYKRLSSHCRVFIIVQSHFHHRIVELSLSCVRVFVIVRLWFPTIAFRFACAEWDLPDQHCKLDLFMRSHFQRGYAYNEILVLLKSDPGVNIRWVFILLKLLFCHVVARFL